MIDTELSRRELPGDVEIIVHSMVFTTRICIGEVGSGRYDQGWCYPDADTALKAAAAWDGGADPPPGWVKEAGTRRRRVEGIREFEYLEGVTFRKEDVAAPVVRAIARNYPDWSAVTALEPEYLRRLKVIYRNGSEPSRYLDAPLPRAAFEFEGWAVAKWWAQIAHSIPLQP